MLRGPCRSWGLRLQLVVTLLVLAVGGFFGATAVTAVVRDDPPEARYSPADLQPDGSGAVVAVSAPARDGRAPRAVRVYRSKTGLTCPRVGRTKGGDFGQVDREDGTFRPEPLDATGSCADLDQEPFSVAMNYEPETGSAPGRAVLFGVLTSQVASVELRIAGRPVPLARNADAYLAEMSMADAANAEVRVSLRDGTTKTVQLSGDPAPLKIPPVTSP